jgi:hypothetical protein
MCAGMGLGVLVQQVQDLGRGLRLLRPVMRPDGRELGLLSIRQDAEQILQPAFKKRIAFHVEEDVVGVGHGKPGQAPARFG